MKIEELVRGGDSSTAILDAPSRRSVSYLEMREAVEQAGRALAASNAQRDLAFLYASNSADSIVLYLASLVSGIPLVLLEPRPLNLLSLTGVYSPSALLLPSNVAIPDGYGNGQDIPACPSYRVYQRASHAESFPRCDPRLALLLQTSGSTGSPKLVRLTTTNFLSNASSIIEYLGIGPEERSIQSLPMHYSYGLSLINSHFMAGATVVLTPHSFMMADFWQTFDENRCTSFAGVPFVYESLHRIGFEPSKHPTLRTMTQAGGGLRRDLIAHFCEKTRNTDVRFFVMYGQTEATARISYVPYERLPQKIGSIGIPIPGMTLHLEPVEGISTAQELIAQGPNVMMGYAEGRDALAAGDTLHGVLRTGDLATVDAEGFYFLAGRLQRFAKLFGNRINLADVEAFVERTHGVEAAAVEGSNALDVYVVPGPVSDTDAIARSVAKFLDINLRSVILHSVKSLPRTQAGKKDYSALKR